MTSLCGLSYSCQSVLTCKSGYSSECVCAVTSIRLNSMGPAKIGSGPDAVRIWGPSWMLEQILSTLSVEERRENVLHIRRAKLREAAIHPCCSNRHCDQSGSLEHLFFRWLEKSMRYPTRKNKDVPGSTPLVC